MATWLMDTALLKTLATPKAASVHTSLEKIDASVFLSAASLTEIAAVINKILSSNQFQRGEKLRIWFDDLTSLYVDRIHPVDPKIAMRAGALMPQVKNANGHPRHHFHDALLVATAQIRGHGLLTRREGIFGPWTQIPVATI
jgi:predicted nucleic acid-binding protein